MRLFLVLSLKHPPCNTLGFRGKWWVRCRGLSRLRGSRESSLCWREMSYVMIILRVTLGEFLLTRRRRRARLKFKTQTSIENGAQPYKMHDDLSAMGRCAPAAQSGRRKKVLNWQFLENCWGEKQKTSLGLSGCNKPFLITVSVIEPIQNRFISRVTQNNWNTDNVWFQFTSNKVVIGFSLQS